MIFDLGFVVTDEVLSRFVMLVASESPNSDLPSENAYDVTSMPR